MLTVIQQFINTQYFPYFFSEVDFNGIRRLMCIYDLPVFEYLLCGRYVAEGQFQSLDIKHVLALRNCSCNSHQVSQDPTFLAKCLMKTYWRKMAKDSYLLVLLQYFSKRVGCVNMYIEMIYGVTYCSLFCWYVE